MESFQQWYLHKEQAACLTKNPASNKIEKKVNYTLSHNDVSDVCFLGIIDIAFILFFGIFSVNLSSLHSSYYLS